MDVEQTDLAEIHLLSAGTWLGPTGQTYLHWSGAESAASQGPQSGVQLVQFGQSVQMAQPGAVGVVLVGGWWGSFAVHQVEGVAREGVSGVENAAGPLGRLTTFDAVDVVSPCTVGVKSSGLGYVVR